MINEKVKSIKPFQWYELYRHGFKKSEHRSRIILLRNRQIRKSINEAAALTETRTEEAKEIRRKTKTNSYRSKKLTVRKDRKMNCLTATFSKEQILIIPEATKKGYTEIENGDCFDMLHPNSKTRRGRKMKDKSNCLTIVHPEFYRYQNARIRRLTPRECCRLQTIPEAETEKILSSGVSDSQIYKMLGNGWTVSVIAYILKHL